MIIKIVVAGLLK